MNSLLVIEEEVQRLHNPNINHYAKLVVRYSVGIWYPLIEVNCLGIVELKHCVAADTLQGALDVMAESIKSQENEHAKAQSNPACQRGNESDYPTR